MTIHPEFEAVVCSDAAEFPEREEAVKASWCPIYLEPMAGSGERLCIGVAAYNDTGCYIEPVVALDRLRCLYDSAGDFLAWCAGEAIEDLDQYLRKGGSRNINGWQPPVEGFELGNPTKTAGASLSQIAANGLVMSASIVPRKIAVSDADESIGSKKLELLVRDLVMLEG